jgi:hypothetical protein
MYYLVNVEVDDDIIPDSEDLEYAIENIIGVYGCELMNSYRIKDLT